MEKRIIRNSIKTPDGTILTSRYRHDYQEHKDKNGELYMVDGGTSYLRRTLNETPYEDRTVTEDSPFEEIRQAFERGGRGKDGNQPLTYTPLAKMSDNWIIMAIAYILKGNLNWDIKTVERVANYDNYLPERKEMVNLVKEEVKLALSSNSRNTYATDETLNDLAFYLNQIYLRELEYRIEHDIFIPDNA